MEVQLMLVKCPECEQVSDKAPACPLIAAIQ